MNELVEFLRDRLAEEETADERRILALCGAEFAPDAQEARRRVAGTLAWQAMKARYAAGRAGVTLAASVRPGRVLLRSIAARHADHPNFREEWKP